jgi:transcription initiation factor TFIID subunit 2
VPTIKAPTPAPAATPKSSKQKRSKIVKMALRPELLVRFPSDGSKKRKLQVNDSDRPNKRQSLEPNGFNSSGGKSGLVSVDKSGIGEHARFIVKMRFGKGVRLPVEK